MKIFLYQKYDIYKSNRLVAELRVYTEDEIKKVEYQLLKKMVEAEEKRRMG